MDIVSQLRNNKGTVSSKLSENLAREVIAGEFDILKEAVELTSFSITSKEEKNIRSGAAKIVEVVAMEKPDIVVPYLEELLPALEAKEPQTRWMVMRTMGYCSKYNQIISQKAVIYAKKFIREKKDGLCLASSVDLFLGDFGEVSRENTQLVYPLLIESTKNVLLNEHDWLLEAFRKIIKHLNEEEKQEVLSFAINYKMHPRKKTQERIDEIEKMIAK